MRSPHSPHHSACLFVLSITAIVLQGGTSLGAGAGFASEGKASPESAGRRTPFALENNPLIEAMVDSVSEEQLRTNIETLVGFYTRNTNSDTLSDTLGIGAARRWVHRRFQDFGDSTGGRIQPLYFDFDATICSITRGHRNVLGIQPGVMPLSAERIFIVTGHLDSRHQAVCEASGFAPGANDDGSGSAAVVELARVMSKFDLEATVVYTTITGEEQGLYGSTAYAEYASGQGLLIDGVINNDVIGNIVGDNGITDSTSVRHFSEEPQTSPSRQLARYMKLKGEQYVPEMTVTLIPAQDRPGRSGDHVPFNREGYAAVRFTEANEAFIHQHNPTDLPEFMNFPYLARVVQINVAGLASLALAPATPAGLVVADPGTGSELFLAWPSMNEEPDFAGYRAAVRMVDSLSYAQVVSVGDTNEFTLGGLEDGQPVYMSISAVDVDGNESVFSQEVLATPRSIPAPPSGVKSTSREISIELVWAANTELDLEGYNVYRSTTSGSGYELVGSVLSPDTLWTDSAAEPSTMYYYRITAFDESDEESEFSEEVRGRLATHDAGIIVVDATLNGSGAPLQPTDEKVDAFYRALTEPYNVSALWDLADSTSGGTLVTDADLAIYSTVIWHSDRTNGTSFRDTTAMRKYLDAGGRMLLCGWNLARSVGGDFGSDHEYPEGTFMHDYVKVDSARTAPAEPDFLAAEALVPGYPNIVVDSVKVEVFDAKLYNIDVLLPPLVDEPVTEAIYRYSSAQGEDSPFHGKPVALRHLGEDVKIVVLDFPLFFMDSLSAGGVIRAAMADLEEPVGVPGGGTPGDAPLPLVHSLNQNYPNPFNPVTSIRYAVPRSGQVTLAVYDLHGRKVRTLVSGEQKAGRHVVVWDGTDDRGRHVASGMYFYRLIAERFTQSRKVVLLR